MATSILRKFQRWATLRDIAALLTLFLFFNLVIIPRILSRLDRLSNGTGIIDMLPSYTPDKLYAHLAAFDAQGRQFYMLHELTIDVIYPAISALLFSLAAAYLLCRTFANRSRFQYLALIPLLVMLVDYLENLCIVTLLAAYPHRLPALAQIANLFTIGKWALSAVEAVLVVGSLAGFLILKLHKTQTQKGTYEHGQ